MDDLISRQAAIDALWKALYAYEDKTEKQFIESEDLKIEDWMQHRIFVQNMSGIDIKIILDLPTVQSERKKAKWIKRTSLFQCSACERFFTLKYNYCPNCGCEMTEGADNDPN